jgi:hypothetical protein
MNTDPLHLCKIALAAGLFFALSCEKLERTNPYDPQITFSTILEKGYEAIHNDLTITPEGNPYHVTTNIQVEATLTIEPGVIFKFDAGVGIGITRPGARIIARGNDAMGQSIDFLPSGSSSWGGINVAGAESTCVFEHCRISNGSILINDKFIMRHCTVLNSSLTTNGSPTIQVSSFATIDSNSFSSNSVGGNIIISLRSSVPVRFTHNTISGYVIMIGDTCRHEILENDCFRSPVVCSKGAVAKIWDNKLMSLQCDSGSPDIRYNSFKSGRANTGSGNGGRGIFLHWGSNPVIRYNVFDSLTIGIWIKTVNDPGTGTVPTNNNPDIQCNNFNTTVTTAVSLLTSGGTGEAKQTSAVSAPNNYWGTTDSVQIENRIYDFADDTLNQFQPNPTRCGRVNFIPFRTSSVDSAGSDW